MDVRSWSVEDVCQFLSELKLTRMIEDCRYHKISGIELITKPMDELQDLLSPMSFMTENEMLTLQNGIDGLKQEASYTKMDRPQVEKKPAQKEKRASKHRPLSSTTSDDKDGYEDVSEVNLPPSVTRSRVATEESISRAPLPISFDDAKPSRPSLAMGVGASCLLDTCTRSGWLHKRGDVVKKWKPRFFVLHSGSMYYFKSPQDEKVTGSFSLSKYRIDRSLKYKREHSFQLIHENPKAREWVLAASDAKDKQEWLKSIRIEIVSYSDSTEPLDEDLLKRDSDGDDFESGDSSDDGDGDYEEPFDDSLPEQLQSQRNKPLNSSMSAPKLLPKPFGPPSIVESIHTKKRIQLEQQEVARERADAAEGEPVEDFCLMELNSLPYFFSEVTRDKCGSFLRRNTFLLRKSSEPNVVVVSVCTRDKEILHFKVYYLVGLGFTLGLNDNRFFPCMPKLLDYYRSTPFSASQITLGEPMTLDALI